MRYTRSPHALWRTTPMHLLVATPTGAIIDVGLPGVDVWGVIEEPRTEGQVVGAIAELYELTPPEVEAGVLSVLGRLEAEQLAIRVA